MSLQHEHLLQVFARLKADERITSWHISIYMSIYYLWILNGLKNPVPITRKLLMSLSHIKSAVTYHKCMNQLQQYGYITYTPSYNPAGSIALLLN
jgi:hypothetical protein